MTRAELLLLDEPTSGLDPLMEQRFRECIEEAKRRGQTVFLSSHILSEVEALCDRVAILRQGELLEIGSLAEMLHATITCNSIPRKSLCWGDVTEDSRLPKDRKKTATFRPINSRPSVPAVG